MINIYFLQAWRNICRNKVQSMLTLLGLAVALFCFTFFAHLVYGNLIEDTELQDADRVVKLKLQHLGTGQDYSSNIECTPELMTFLNEADEVESYCCSQSISIDWNYCRAEGQESDFFDAKTDARILRMDTTMMEFLDLDVLAGSWQDAVSHDNSILLVKETAIAMFGSMEQALSKSMHSYEATGVVRAVVEKLPYNCSLRISPDKCGFFLNNTSRNANNPADIWVKCKRSYTKQQLAEHLERAHIVYPRYDGDEVQVLVDDYRAWTWDKIWYSISRFLLITLPGSLILLAALSNFFHLLVSDVLARQREFVLRRVHGAKTYDLWYMVGAYVTLMFALVGFLSLLIIEVFFPIFDLTAQGNTTTMDMSTMMRQNAWALLALVMIGLLIAWMAVVRVRRRTLQESIKSSSGRRPGRHIWRNILLGYQLTLALVFLILLGAVVLQEQVNYESIASQLTAQEKEDLLVLQAAHNNYFEEGDEYTQKYLDLIAQCPDIQEYHIVDHSIGSKNLSFSRQRFLREGNDLDTLYMHEAQFSTEDFQFLHYQLTEGRWAETPDEVVVEAEFLQVHQLKIGDKIRVEKQRKRETPLDVENPERLSPFELAIVQNFDYEQYTYTITGYFDAGPAVNMKVNSQMDINGWHLGCVYFNDGNTGQELWMRCYPGKGREVARQMTEQLRLQTKPTDIIEYGTNYQYKTINYDKVLPVSDFIDEKNDKSIGPVSGYFWMLASIAIALTLLGIYSAISVDTRFRRKEMAVRKINGAKTWQIAFIFLRLYIIEMAVASILAIMVGEILINRVIEMFRVGFHHGVLFYAAMVLIMSLFVALTIGMQIWCIARVQPAEIIKSE